MSEPDILYRIAGYVDAGRDPQAASLLSEAGREIERLRNKLVGIETELAVTLGAIKSAATTREAEEDFRVTHDVPSNTPR